MMGARTKCAQPLSGASDSPICCITRGRNASDVFVENGRFEILPRQLWNEYSFSNEARERSGDLETDAMSENRWEKVEGLFHRALELSADERDAFLTHASAGDEALRAEVLEMLRAEEAGSEFRWMKRSGAAVGGNAASSDSGASDLGDVPLPESDDAARELGLDPVSSGATWDSENTYIGFYRHWRDLLSAPPAAIAAE